jgi:hypothetical protein
MERRGHATLKISMLLLQHGGMLENDLESWAAAKRWRGENRQKTAKRILFVIFTTLCLLLLWIVP